jgi:hypothetical protein
LHTGEGAKDTASLFGTLRVEEPSELSTNIIGAPASFGPPLNSKGISGPVTLAVPITACDPLKNLQEVLGKIVLVERGGCYFFEKVAYAQSAGAIGVVVVDIVKDNALFTMSGDPNDPENIKTKIPSLLITHEDGGELMDYLRKGGKDLYATLAASFQYTSPEEKEEFVEVEVPEGLSDSELLPFIFKQLGMEVPDKEQEQKESN